MASLANTYLHLHVLLLFIAGSRVLAQLTTGYKLKGDSFYLSLSPMPNGYGSEGRSVLLSALSNFTGVFKQSWIDGIEAADGTVNSMSDPTFDINRWLGGEEDLPAVDLYPDGNGGFVQKVSYVFTFMRITGSPMVMSGDDEWTAAAFDGNSFLPYLQENDVNGIFESVVSVDYFQDFTSEYTLLTYHRLPSQEIYLEVGPRDDVTTKSFADKVVNSLDMFLEDELVPSWKEQLRISSGVQPPRYLYFVKSAFLNGTEYFDYGQYYTISKELVDSYTTDKGTCITKYGYKMDIHIWLPHNETPSWDLFPVEEYIADNSLLFLPYLKDVVEDDEPAITFVDVLDNSTIPTQSPSRNPILSTAASPPTTSPETAAPTVPRTPSSSYVCGANVGDATENFCTNPQCPSGEVRRSTCCK